MKRLDLAFRVLMLLRALSTPSAFGEDLLPAEEDDGFDELLIDEEDRVSEAELLKRMERAITELGPGKKRTQLLRVLKVLVHRKDIVVGPRRLAKFRNALLESAAADELRPYVPKLLKLEDADVFDMGARGWLNLGVQLSVAAGGAPFAELKTILDKRRDIIDLEWMLPALGRAGGKKALSVLRPFRQDRGIIPLGNVQNIRRVPCAAVLGCAYAGDSKAFEMTMEWYEQDYAARPRFAWYLQWAKQEGHKITDRSYALLDYCEHRIKQAERLLDFVLDGKLSQFIEWANRDLRIGLTDYLVRRLGRAAPEQLPRFAGLLAHPSLIVKRQVLKAFLEYGTVEQRTEAMRRIRDMLTSRRSLDRLFAVETLLVLDTDDGQRILTEAIGREANQALRFRFEGLWQCAALLHKGD